MDPRNQSYQVQVANGDKNFVMDLTYHRFITNATCNGLPAIKTGFSYSCDFSDSTSTISYFAFNGEVIDINLPESNFYTS